MYSKKAQAIFWRFINAGVCGFFGSVGIVTIAVPKTWTEFNGFIGIIALSGAYGFVTGIIMAGKKWYQWKE
jgi:hypothetical protein